MGETLRTSTFNLALATGQCATLLRSGLPLTTALSTIADMTPCRSLNEALRDIHNRVSSGFYLSQAMRLHPGIFSRSYLALVVAGEGSGRLPNNLQRCADWLEQDDELTRRLKAAAAYPLLVVAVSLTLTVILFTTFLPRLFVIFADSGTPLPLVTRVMMFITWLATRWWSWLALAVAVYGLLLKLRDYAALEQLQRWAREVPVLGHMLRMAALARFAQTLSSLLECGLPITAAWGMAAESSGDVVLAHDGKRVVAAIKQGSTLAQAVDAGSIYPRGLASWLQMGEDTACLPVSLRKMGQIFKLEADLRMETLTALLEPLFVAAMGGFVMLVLVSIMLPLYGNLMQLSGS